MTKSVWILECRKNQGTYLNCEFTSVFSSVEKSLEWIKENQDYDDGEFWWAVFYSEVDKDSLEQEIPERDLFLFNSKGEEIFWQPDPDEHVIAYGDRVQFYIDGNPETPFSQSELEGIITGIENDVVQFDQVIESAQRETASIVENTSSLYVKGEKLRYVVRPKMIS